MNRLLIVDGSNLLFQMFYGMPARIVNSQGKAIQGTLGFVGALLKIIRQTKPTHVLVVFDGENGGERRSLDEAYKANRPDYSQMPDEETPFSQMDDVYASLDELGIMRFETDGCEADDLIAAYALSDGFLGDIVIASFDSDYFQLISDRVRVLRYRGKHTAVLTAQDVFARFGVWPDRYADFKALVGDAADNIRGAEKVGPKTAAALLGEFGSLEGVIRRAQEIKKPSVRESILASGERLMRNARLIRLLGDAAMPFAWQQLAYTDQQRGTRDVLKGIGLM